MHWCDYLIAFAQAIVAGIIGAWIVHILDYRKFRKEEKYRDDRKKRDTLRDLLGDVVPDMRTILTIGASALSILKCWVKTLKLDACILGGKTPIHFRFVGVAILFPSSRFPLQRRRIWNTLVQALS